MKRTLILLLAFLSLGGITTWYLLTQQDDKTTLMGAERRFAVENTDDIHKIFIANRRGETTTLERRDGYWLFNGEFKARPNAIENLLDAIRRVQVKYKPPQAAVENIVRDLATNGLKVEIYDSRDQLLKSYYVGGGTPDERGTYMIIDGAEQPYVASIPGWEGNLRFRYNLTGEDWRDKTVFAYQPDDIQSVAVAYPKQRNKSFRLERAGGGFEVTPYYEVTPRINQPLAPGKVEAYLTNFESLVAEAFENENIYQDSIKQLVPFSIIAVTDRTGEVTQARLFPIIPKADPAYNLEGADTVERYLADVNGEDFMLIQHRVFSKILWGYDSFFENEAVQ